MLINWFSAKKKPKEIAKDRLRVVLVQDRLSLAPALMESMKDDVILAISKYVEIDTGGIEFVWKDLDRRRALVASIPVVALKRGLTANDRASQRPY
ncbi:MAG: cell division topological specificity factor MinE [Bacillota bacterium]